MSPVTIRGRQVEIERLAARYEHYCREPTSYAPGYKPVDNHSTPDITPTRNSEMFLLHNFLSDEDCAELMEWHSVQVAEHSKAPPMVCFQDRKYHEHAGIRDHFVPGTGCLRTEASALILPHLKWSTSTATHYGENDLVDRMYGFVVAPVLYFVSVDCGQTAA